MPYLHQNDDVVWLNFHHTRDEECFNLHHNGARRLASTFVVCTMKNTLTIIRMAMLVGLNSRRTYDEECLHPRHNGDIG